MTGEPVTHPQFVIGAALHFGYVAHVDDSLRGDVAVLLAAVLGAVDGRGVHVLTTTDHAARRQATRARAICDLLGVSVGVLTPTMQSGTRKDNYATDITYGAAEQFAYDRLRDNLGSSMDDIVQRDRHRALITDADVVLLDQCRTPMLITAPDKGRAPWAEQCARLATVLVPGRDYVIPEGRGVIALTDQGAELARAHLGVADIYDATGTIITSIRAALRAKEFYLRGRDYDIAGGRITLLDNESGALSPTGPSGELRQALEAKEGLAVSAPTVVLATMTMRGYVRCYRHLSGISASAAMPEAWDQLYGLDTVTVPPARPSGRVDHDDRLFPTNAQRDDAVLADVLKRREAGQSVVIGALTVSAAEQIVAELTDIGVPVRQAIHADPEQVATVLAAAGDAAAVTVLLSAACRDVETELDGLAVLGMGRHHSRRHDQPLRGLAGRNGTSGECTFFLSLADLTTWTGQEERPAALVARLREGPAEGTHNRALTAGIAQWQRDTDARLVQAAVAISGFDDVRQQQYETMAEYRRGLLTAENIDTEFLQIVSDMIDELIDEHVAVDGPANRSAVESLLAAATAIPLAVGVEDLIGASRTLLRDRLREEAARAHRVRSTQVDQMVGRGASGELQRRVVLTCLDKAWRGHLTTLDQLYEDVTRSVGSVEQKLAEFRIETAAAYRAIWPRIWTESIGFFFHLDINPAT